MPSVPSSGSSLRSSVPTLTMPQDENAPLEDPSGPHVATKKATSPLTTSKLVNQSTTQVSAS